MFITQSSQQREMRFFVTQILSLLVRTSPWWSHNMSGVIDDELKVIHQQDVYASGGGDPRSVWGKKKDKIVRETASVSLPTLENQDC